VDSNYDEYPNWEVCYFHEFNPYYFARDVARWYAFIEKLESL
jgi:hypothetical protein